MMKLTRWMVGVVLASVLLVGATARADETLPASARAEPASVYRDIGLGAAAAFAVAISILGAAHAVGRIGSAALGAAVEKPELLTRSLLFVALAEGLGVLGFAIAIMLVQKI
jgi:V/A-type H+-transporting ATPase subunit K